MMTSAIFPLSVFTPPFVPPSSSCPIVPAEAFPVTEDVYWLILSVVVGSLNSIMKILGAVEFETPESSMVPTSVPYSPDKHAHR